MADETKRKATLKAPKRDENASLTMMMLREELDTIRLVPLYINDNNIPNYISTQIGNNVKKLFSSLGIKNATDPKSLRIIKAKQRANLGIFSQCNLSRNRKWLSSDILQTESGLFRTTVQLQSSGCHRTIWPMCRFGSSSHDCRRF